MDHYSILRAAGNSFTVASLVAEAAAKGNEGALRFIERAREKIAALDPMPPEAGKRYRTRRGQIVGPLQFDAVMTDVDILVAYGHSRCKTVEIALAAARGDQFALKWIAMAREKVERQQKINRRDFKLPPLSDLPDAERPE